MKLHHPTLVGHVVDVPGSAVESWTEQGWRKTEPKQDKAVDAPDPKKGN